MSLIKEAVAAKRSMLETDYPIGPATLDQCMLILSDMKTSVSSTEMALFAQTEP